LESSPLLVTPEYEAILAGLAQIKALPELHAMNDLACEAQKEKEALAAAKAAQEAVDGQKEEEAVEQIMASIAAANDREQFIEDLTDLMKGGKLDVTKCNGV